MKVSEVKRKISSLKFDHDNMVRLQDLLGSTGKENCDKIQRELENSAGLRCSLYDLCSDVAETLRDEIDRLEKIIDNADVQI